ncbi:MAG TPA: glycosyltransferase family 2 protein [Puia sp.]|jgi:glycosyltransferase involved in cell wall biosynthesis|nr:glycosyltransferase family 2 protein [Puia sp.]
MKISVVIIAKNEASCIQKCIGSALEITQDVIVVDTGSTDDTVEISRKNNARTFLTEWNGYGEARNMGATKALYDWVFSLDADEIISKELASELLDLREPEQHVICKIKRRVFWGNKKINYGSWRGDSVVRLYNKQFTQWDSRAVHEQIEAGKASVLSLKNPIDHHTVKSLADFTNKQIHYAQLWALEANKKNKRSNYFKQLFSPVFDFLQGYIFRLGILDGLEGFWIATTSAFYTYLKYAILMDLQKRK